MCLVHQNASNLNMGPLSEPNRLDLVTIAFNNCLVIQHQIRLIRKYLQEPFYYTVADNSSDPLKREQIGQTCLEQNVPYLELPSNLSVDTGSRSHGTALNWVYSNYIKPRQAEFFGFIDHDIYPIKATQIIPFLNKYPIFGLIQKREKEWYLWPGFCFYRTAFVKDLTLNFMPVPGKDTGGGNWEPLYSGLNLEEMPKVFQQYGNLRPGNVPQSDWIEYIGDWVHTFNASYNVKCLDKEDLVNNFLNQY